MSEELVEIDFRCGVLEAGVAEYDVFGLELGQVYDEGLGYVFVETCSES